MGCCTCYSCWTDNVDNAKATAIRGQNYTITDGPQTPEEVIGSYNFYTANQTAYGGGDAQCNFVLDGDPPPKNMPIFTSSVIKNKISDYKSCSECDCTTSNNPQLIDSNDKDIPWKENPVYADNVYYEGNGHWELTPNTYHGGGSNPDFPIRKDKKCKVRWTYTKHWYDQEGVIKKYEARHECCTEGAPTNGPAPKEDTTNTRKLNLRKLFKNWKPVW